MMMQTQLLQQMAQNMQNNGNGNGNAPPHVRDKRGEFLKGHPPIFKHSTDPLEADDLEIAQCDDREKVLYVAGQLQGAALDWWDLFRFGRTDTDPITWMEFRNAFRSHHVPAGLMKLKKKEFLSLEQGGMSVAEYRDSLYNCHDMLPLKWRMMRRGRNYSWKV